ncbi:MAG: DUF6062 family protein [Chloroflexota bacterium]|nr:DUF6062 family protein [Chloroflexota bacterium]
MGRTSTHASLLEAFQTEGCPVCRLALNSARSYLHSLSYEGGLTDPDVRDRLRASHGFCSRHAYLWLDQQHVLGTAILYDDLLAHISEELRNLRYRRRGGLSGLTAWSGGRSQGEALNPHEPCIPCQVEADTELFATRTLLSSLSEPEFWRLYRDSAGLCLPHLQMALEAAETEESFAQLVEATVHQHEALRQLLQQIIRRHDYRFSDEATGEERGAEAQAVRKIAGEPGMAAAARAPRRRH